MKEKKCTKCGVTKSVDEFYSDRSKKDGKATNCKVCRAAQRANWYQTNRERILAKEKEYYRENKEEIITRVRGYYFENKEKVEKYKRIWRKANSEKLSEQARHRQRKLRENPVYRLSDTVSVSVRAALRRSGNTKGGKTFDALPYTPQQLKEHIESQFQEGMTWDNHGEWHIDHIIPQAALQYDSLEHENFQKCWALDNLQPLWATDNIRKSSVFEGKRHRYKK